MRVARDTREDEVREITRKYEKVRDRKPISYELLPKCNLYFNIVVVLFINLREAFVFV